MLSKIWVRSALIAKREIPFRLNGYKWRIKNITALDYNTNPKVASELFKKLSQIIELYKNLYELNTVLGEAVDKLPERPRLVIKQRFCDVSDKETIMRYLKVDDAGYKYLTNKGYKLVGKSLSEAGYSDEVFIETFDEEPLIIRSYLYAKARLLSGKNLKLKEVRRCAGKKEQREQIKEDSA